MRTNIEIDDDLMAHAMAAGPYTTKKEAVEAGLKLLKRQAAYREILKWEGRLKWEGDESIDWTQPADTTDAAPLPGDAAARKTRDAAGRGAKREAKPVAKQVLKQVTKQAPKQAVKHVSRPLQRITKPEVQARGRR